MRKSKIILALLLGMFVVFQSCEKKEQLFDENMIAERLTFENADFNIDKGPGGILKFTWDEWGRAKKDCDGWGLCNFTLVPNDYKSSSEEYNFSAKLEIDLNDNYYFDIVLAEPVPEDVPIESFPIMIDGLIEVDSYEIIGQNLSAKGEYPFNNEIGEFGGFRIYLY